MKIEYTAAGNPKLTMSKADWLHIGKQAQWGEGFAASMGENMDREEDQSRGSSGRASYTSLNDAVGDDPGFAPGSTQVWYWKSEFSRDLLWGDFSMVDPENLQKTHVLMGSIKETNPDNIFRMMNLWSKNGEANKLLGIVGSDHTSMSVGDIVVINGKIIGVDKTGWKELN